MDSKGIKKTKISRMSLSIREIFTKVNFSNENFLAHVGPQYTVLIYITQE